MKASSVFCCIIVLISISFSPVTADREIVRITSGGESAPRLVAYFDPGLTQRTVCLNEGDTIVVFLAVENCPAPIDRLVYKLTCSAPPLLFIDETFETGTATGDFNSGVDLEFSVPADASGQLLVQTLRFVMTVTCNIGCEVDSPEGIVTAAHPVLGSKTQPSSFLAAGGEIVVYGHSSMVCDDDGLSDLEIASFTSPDTAMMYEDISSRLEVLVYN